MSESKTTLRILNDIAGTEKTVEVERDRGELAISLMHVAKVVRRQHKFIHLAVHFTHEIITMHRWESDLDYAKSLSKELEEMYSLPQRTLELLQEARIG